MNANISEQLAQLSALHQAGKLSDAEFSRAKEKLLSPAPGTVVTDAVKGLHRSSSDRWVGGVCGGLAKSFGVPSWTLRMAFALLVLCAGTGVVAYLLAWIFLPLSQYVRIPIEHH